MKPIDFAKAIGIGVLLLALNLLLTTAVIFVYAGLFAPGRTQAEYTALAPQIGAWSGPIGGVVLLFVAGWLFARRRPERNALLFAMVVWDAYALLDIALGLPMGGVSALLTVPFVTHMALSLAAALLGAHIARRQAA